METRIVQDTDDDASDVGAEEPALLSLGQEEKGTSSRLMQELYTAHTQMMEEEKNEWPKTGTSADAVRGVPLPAINVQRETSYGNVSVPGLTTSETISSDHTIHLDPDEGEIESQKRKADIDLTDEDEVCFVPAKKKQRGDGAGLGQPIATEAATRASMPPPASQESIVSRVSAISQRSALKVQPSPPRLQDNLSFTTTNSSTTSFQGGRGARMFPSLESDSFQQRLNNMELDTETEPDSMPASQDDPTLTGPWPPSTQNENGNSSLEGSGKSNGDTGSKDAYSSPSNISVHEQLKEPRERGDIESGPPIGRSSTMVRVEVPMMRTEDIESYQAGPQSSDGASRKNSVHERRTDSPVSDGSLADGEETAMQDVVKVERKEKTKKSKSKKAPKKRGRPRKIEASDTEEAEADEDGATQEQKASKSDSFASSKAVDDQEPATTSNATSFIADTPSPELAAGEPVNLPVGMPATPDKDSSESVRSGKHSPLNNGKVPLRVGLSKRRHVEPLLKTVRK